MCVNVEIVFERCEHHDATLDQHIICKDYPICGPVQTYRPIPGIHYLFSSYCNACLLDPQTKYPDELESVEYDDYYDGDGTERVELVLDLVAAPGEQYRTYEEPGGAQHTIDFHDDNSLQRFWSSMISTHGIQIETIHDDMCKYIQLRSMFKTAPLTANEFTFFRQIRIVAADNWARHIYGSRGAEVLGPNMNEVAARTPVPDWMASVLTPGEAPEDDESPESTICTNTLGFNGESGQDSEEAVELPCGHTFGTACIVTWARGKRSVSCPNCRRKFEASIDFTEIEEHDDKNRPWWLDLILDAYGRDCWGQWDEPPTRIWD